MSRWREASPLIKASAGLHGVALVSAAVAPQTIAIAAATVVANHLLIAGAGMFPRGNWLGPNVTRLPASSAEGRLALTFDDGPDPDVTPKVLDMLERHGHRATFFCIGAHAEAHPDLIADICSRGHGVENHSYSHPNTFALRGPRGLSDEIVRAQDAIERTSGRRPRFFRAPAGIQNPWLARVLVQQKLRLVSWTRRGFDTVNRSTDDVIRRLVGGGVTAGDILLLHDRITRRDQQSRAIVIDVLPPLIEAIERANLRSEALHVVLDDRS